MKILLWNRMPNLFIDFFLRFGEQINWDEKWKVKSIMWMKTNDRIAKNHSIGYAVNDEKKNVTIFSVPKRYMIYSTGGIERGKNERREIGNWHGVDVEIFISLCVQLATVLSLFRFTTPFPPIDDLKSVDNVGYLYICGKKILGQAHLYYLWSSFFFFQYRQEHY